MSFHIGEGREKIVSDDDQLSRLVKLASQEDKRFSKQLSSFISRFTHFISSEVEALATIAKIPVYTARVVKAKGLTPLLSAIRKDFPEGEKQRWKFVACPTLVMNCDFDVMEHDVLGTGGFGSVYKGHLLPSNTPVAVKAINTMDTKLLGRETTLLGYRFLSTLYAHYPLITNL